MKKASASSSRPATGRARPALEDSERPVVILAICCSQSGRASRLLSTARPAAPSISRVPQSSVLISIQAGPEDRLLLVHVLRAPEFSLGLLESSHLQMEPPERRSRCRPPGPARCDGPAPAIGGGAFGLAPEVALLPAEARQADGGLDGLAYLHRKASRTASNRRPEDRLGLVEPAQCHQVTPEDSHGRQGLGCRSPWSLRATSRASRAVRSASAKRPRAIWTCARLIRSTGTAGWSSPERRRASRRASRKSGSASGSRPRIAQVRGEIVLVDDPVGPLLRGPPGIRLPGPDAATIRPRRTGRCRVRQRPRFSPRMLLQALVSPGIARARSKAWRKRASARSKSERSVSTIPRSFMVPMVSRFASPRSRRRSS